MRKTFTAWMAIFVLLMPFVVRANSAPMKWGGTNSFNLLPCKDDNISVIHEDLTYDIKTIGNNYHVPAEVSVRYTMKNSSSSKEKVIMSFPYESQFGYEYDGERRTPKVSFNGKEVSVVDKGIKTIALDTEIKDDDKSEQIFHEPNSYSIGQEKGIKSFDEVIKAFNDESTKKEGNISNEENQFYGIHLMVFEVEFEPNSTNELTVNYIESSGYIHKRLGSYTVLSTKYSFYYFLEPAKYWKSFGDLDIIIKVPEGYSIEQETLLGQNAVKSENAYKLHFDSLPKENLNFIVKSDKSDSLLSIAISKGIVSYFIYIVIVPCVILALTLMLLKKYKSNKNSAKI